MVIGLVVVLTRGDKVAVIPHHQAQSHGQSTATREAISARLLQRLTAGLEQGKRRQILRLAAPGDRAARTELAAILHNVRALGIAGLSMRYVDEDAGALSLADQQRLGGNAWVGDVQLGWRLGRFDKVDSNLEVTLTFARAPRGAAFVSARGDYGDPAPLWLLSRLAVESSRRSLVMVAGAADLARFSAMADQAVVDVRKVLPGWRGKLVVEVPASEDQLSRTLGSAEHQYDEIAAVTTTVDGSLSRSSPTHIFVNPQVFDPLGERGAQIVMSHEATHVATHAATSSMPTWLLEGFADYVALAHVDLPVSVTASQILADVRKHGPPDHLPGQKEFDAANPALGASYEAAWLACRLLAQTYGEQKLIAFYRMSDRDSSTTQAFRKVFGTNEQEFTNAWRASLRQLAG
jgi:hypothetical protein